MPETRLVVSQVCDGFSYNANNLYLAGRYWPDALAQLDVLRRANNFRARWWVVPDPQNNPVIAADTLYYQLEVSAGSYLWGYNFASLSAVDSTSGAPAETTATDLSIQAVDSCSGVPLFMDFANGGGCRTSCSSGFQPILLTQPRLILEPGLVNIQIANNTTTKNITCQWLLLFAERCRLIDEDERKREWRMLQIMGATSGGRALPGVR